MANVQVFESGWAQGALPSQEKRERKQALSDQELEGKLTDLIQRRSDLVSKLPTLEKGTPDYDEAFNALRQVDSDLRTTYHPENNPSAISKFGHLLTDHLGIKVKGDDGKKVTLPQQRIQKEATKREQGLQGDERLATAQAAAAPISAEQQAQNDVSVGASKRLAEFNADMKFYDQQNPHAASPDATPEEKEAREDYRNERIQFYGQGIKPIQPKETDEYWTDVKGSTPEEYPKGSGKYRIEQVNKRGQHQYRDLPEGYAPPAPKATKMTGPQLLQDSYLATLKLPFGTPWSALSDAQRAGYQLYLNKLKLRSSNHQAAITDRDGNVHIVDLAGSSGPADVSPARSVPTAPTPAQGSAGTKSRGSGSQPTVQDLVLNFKKATPDYTKARNTYNDADRIARLGDKWITIPVGKASEADANFVLSLIRSEAGRVNQQEIAQMFNAGGIAEAPERWAAKAGHGELPPELKRQLLDFVHMQRDAAKEVVDEMNTSGAGASQTGGTSLADRLSNALAGK